MWQNANDYLEDYAIDQLTQRDIFCRTVKVKARTQRVKRLLDKTTIEGIVKTMTPPGMTYKVKASNSSNSVYVRLTYGEKRVEIRISDHEDPKTSGTIPTLLVGYKDTITTIQTALWRVVREIMKGDTV